MYLGVQVSESLGRLIVQTFTTEGLNNLINFPMCNECKKEGQKPIKRLNTKDENTFTLFVQNNELLILIIITSCLHLLNFLLGTGTRY